MNPLLAQLDCRLKQRGEPIYLRRAVGTTNQSFVQIRMPAIVRALTVEQLVGNITQQNFFIITSPSEIYRQQWPGGKTPGTPNLGIIAPSDPRLPTTNDSLWLRGALKAVQRVAPVFDRGECIRIEINVLG